MKKQFTLLALALFLGLAGLHAQTSCTDMNGYVASKDTGTHGYFVLNQGYQEKASQTYHYAGPGRLGSVRIYGNYPGFGQGGVPLKVSVCNVDANGRPTSVIESADDVVWWWTRNITGYLDVTFSHGGAAISNNFAVVVELRYGFPWGNSFRLSYTGNGEGRKEDLASIAGTSTGFNWTSAMTDFSMEGDFYLVPNMTNYISSSFFPASFCLNTGGTMAFTNTSTVSTDSMFNKIMLAGYTGEAQLYAWNFGDGSSVSNVKHPTHTYAAPGVYTVSLTTSLVGWHNSCSNTRSLQISVGLAAAATTVVNSSCYHSDNGSVLAVATGGAPGYAYSINGESYYKNPAFTGLSAGSYTLHIFDTLGCNSSATFTITQPDPIIFTPSQTTNASCNGSNGAILVNATGGSGSLQYQLNQNPFQASGSFTNLPAGSYNISVKDANNCIAKTQIAVSDVGSPALSITSMTNVSCNSGSDGSIVLNATGGSGVLQYSINGGASYQPSGSFPGLASGVYGAMVKDAAGCTQAMEINISQPTGLNLTAMANGVRCHGGNDGQIHVTSAIGGTGDFAYSINGTVYQSLPDFSTISAGTYTVYVKDAAGCTKNTEVVVSQPEALLASVSSTPAICNGSATGGITISGIGGAGGYAFSLDGQNYSSEGTFTDLSAGLYSISVTDQNACHLVITKTVTEPTPVTATITTTSSTCGNSNGGLLVVGAGGTGAGYQYAISTTNYNSNGAFTNLPSATYYIIVADNAQCGNIFQASIADANGPVIGNTAHTNVSCNQGNDGTVSLSNITGGTGTLQYSINGSNWQTSPVFTGLTAGSYIAVVKDANGCTGSVTLSLTEPNPFAINTSIQDLHCYNDQSGTAVIYAAGGSGVFAYSIDGEVFQSSNVFTGLTAGIHSVNVRDGAGCLGFIPVTLTQPTPVIFNAGVLNVSCHAAQNGLISVLASGGAPGYTYSLNGDTYQPSHVFNNLAGGSYTVYVKDSVGCIATKPLTVTEPDQLVVVANLGMVSCAGGSNGSISLNVNGGTSPYAYTWTDGIKYEDLFNLPAGIYHVSVRDNHGCVTTGQYEITQPANPVIVNGVVINATTSSSTDGRITITTTGGVPPYTYSWSNGETSPVIAELAAGNYTVNVKDANNCIATGTFTVTSSTGIETVSGTDFKASMYPNPSSELTTVDVTGALLANIRISSIIGQVVVTAEPNASKFQIDLRSLSSGVYLVEMNVAGKWFTQRLVVNK